MAATKPPVFAGDQHIIERPRLTRMLDESKAKVILLLAPAGYGKTTLARQWLRDKPHVWYRASEADADVAALAVGVMTEAVSLMPGIDGRIRQRMRAARDPEREAGSLAELAAEDLARLPADTWIAIDDYHHIASTPAAELFVRLLLDTPSSRVFLTSRTRPTWATARSVVYGTTAILDRDELTMTEAEAARVIGTSPHEAAALLADAMGWPAVIGLAARLGPERIQGQPLPGDLYEFVADELWRTVPANAQWQLVQMALCSPMPWLVAQDLFPGTAAELLTAEPIVGWVARDGADLVIHPLLRRFLRTRFESFPAAQRKRAITRMIEVLATRHEWDQAMTLVLEHKEAAFSDLLARALDELLQTGRLSTIERWLATALERSIDSPIVKLATAEVAFRHGDYIRAESLARTAAAELSDPLLRARSLNRAGVSAMQLDHLDLSLQLHHEARGSAPDAATLREAIIGEVQASLDLGMRDCERLLDELPDGGAPLDLIRAAGVRLLVALRFGNVGPALEATTVLMPVLSDVRDPLARTSFLFTRAAGLIAHGDYRDAHKLLGILEKESLTYRIDLARIPVKLARAQAEAGLRNFARARKLAAEIVAETQQTADLYWFTLCSGILCRIAAASGTGKVPAHRPELARILAAGLYEEYAAALALAAAATGDLTRAASLAREAREGFHTVDTELLLAWIAAITSGRSSTAVEAYELTLERGVIDIFVTAYRARPQLIAILAQNDVDHSRLEQILMQANDVELMEQLGSESALVRAARRQRLTPREREVYALMADGLSNRRISEHLVIAEATTKLHVRHILQKLCARSRAEAVAKWHDVLGS